MPIPSDLVGRKGEPIEHTVDARWTMAYAASLGETGPAYFDTAARPDVLAHPVFPVCFEWPVFLSGRHLPTQEVLAPAERVRGVHATHDLQLHRPVRAGMEVATQATIVRVEARRPGAYQVIRLDSIDREGRPVCTTWYGTLYRGVAVEGGDRVLEEAEPELPAHGEVGVLAEVAVPVSAGAAHVYTECARIWNPIHTDAAVAAAAGLPAIILHGTATLALGVSRVVAAALGGDPECVARVAGRFTGMVRVPGSLTVRICEPTDGRVRFDVRNEAGETVVRDGLVGVCG
jgi:acyl dehydratase